MLSLTFKQYNIIIIVLESHWRIRKLAAVWFTFNCMLVNRQFSIVRPNLSHILYYFLPSAFEHNQFVIKFRVRSGCGRSLFLFKWYCWHAIAVAFDFCVRTSEKFLYNFSIRFATTTIFTSIHSAQTTICYFGVIHSRGVYMWLVMVCSWVRTQVR